jgi:hypothetical protein
MVQRISDLRRGWAFKLKVLIRLNQTSKTMSGYYFARHEQIATAEKNFSNFPLLFFRHF